MVQTIDVKNGIQFGIDDLVQGISRLNSDELTTFFERLNQKNGGQKPLSIFAEEAILLKKIKAIIPASVIRRFKELKTKQQYNTLSEKEKEEILLITDFIEDKSAERIELLVSLAKIRQISLPDLVKQINLKDYRA